MSIFSACQSNDSPNKHLYAQLSFLPDSNKQGTVAPLFTRSQPEWMLPVEHITDYSVVTSRGLWLLSSPDRNLNECYLWGILLTTV